MKLRRGNKTVGNIAVVSSLFQSKGQLYSIPTRYTCTYTGLVKQKLLFWNKANIYFQYILIT